MNSSGRGRPARGGASGPAPRPRRRRRRPGQHDRLVVELELPARRPRAAGRRAISRRSSTSVHRRLEQPIHPCRRAWRCTWRGRRCGAARRRRGGLAVARWRSRGCSGRRAPALQPQRARGATRGSARRSMARRGVCRRPRAARRTRRRRGGPAVSPARRRRRGVANRRSTVVAGAVAEAVVDRLEVVEVDEEDGRGGGRPAACGREGVLARGRRTGPGWRGR